MHGMSSRPRGSSPVAGSPAPPPAKCVSAWYVVPTPPEVIQDVTVRNVKDDEGRTATFRIMLFSDEFRWRINSFDAVERAASARSSRRR